MNKTDALVAAIGAGVLVVALAGAMMTSSGTAGTGVHDVVWADRHAEHDLGGAATQGSGEAQVVWENPHRNTTELEFTVTVAAGAPHVVSQADQIRVLVVAPDGTEHEATGELGGVAGGEVVVPVRIELASVPETAVARGASPSAALAALAAEHTTENGLGAWTITISVSHGGLAPDEHTVAVGVAAHWYEAELAPPAPMPR